jgi:hypothetical protein
MMRATAVAVLLAGFVGCSGTEGTTGDLPPVLEITSPERGTIADGDQVTVSGRVQDDSPAVAVTINGTEVAVNADGTFQTTLVVRDGMTMIETHAIDSAGHDVRDVRAVLAGTLAPTDGSVASPVGARLGTEGLRTVGRALGDAAETIDFTAAAMAMNPVYNNDGCLGAKIDITSVDVGGIDVGLTPKTGSVTTAVGIHNVTVRLRANFKVACIGGSTNITVRSTKARINGNLGVRLASGKLATSLTGTTVALDGFSIDVGGVPGAIEDLLKGEARKAAENALKNAIQDKVPPMADDLLGGLVAKPYTAAIFGHDTNVMVKPTEVELSTDGLYVALDTRLSVSGGQGGVFVSSPMPLSSSLMPTDQLGLALADDVVNQLFSGLWAAGALELTASIESIPALSAILDDDARSLAVSALLPPTVTSDASGLELAVGDLMVSVRDEADIEIQRLALSVTTTLSAGPTQSGKIRLTVGTPTLKAQVISHTDAVERPMTDAQIEGIITGAWGLVGSLADDALGNLPLPTIAGVTMGAPTVQGATGYVVADVPLQ